MSNVKIKILTKKLLCSALKNTFEQRLSSSWARSQANQSRQLAVGQVSQMKAPSKLPVTS